jgi:hypothetical protein
MDKLVPLTGYVSRFDSPDRGGDIVRRAAFLGLPAAVPLLWQHDPARPIGRVLSLFEDGVGLKMVAGVSADCRDGLGVGLSRRTRACGAWCFAHRLPESRGIPPGDCLWETNDGIGAVFDGRAGHRGPFGSGRWGRTWSEC